MKMHHIFLLVFGLLFAVSVSACTDNPADDNISATVESPKTEPVEVQSGEYESVKTKPSKVVPVETASIEIESAEIETIELESAGVWCYLPRPRDASYDYLKLIGNSEFISISDVGDWTGTFTGTSEDYGMQISHFTDRIMYIGVVSFDAVEVDGKSGGLEMYVSGKKPDLNSDWRGSWVITLGRGELANLQGHGSWWGPGWYYNYSECAANEYSVEELVFESD